MFNKNLKTNLSNDKQSTFLNNTEVIFRGAPVISNSIDSSQPLWDRMGQLNKLGNSYVPQKSSNLTPNTFEVVQEEINIPDWENCGEDTMNLRNTFETDLSALNVLNKLKNFLIEMNCDVTIHKAKGEICGRKFNEKSYDISSFNIFLYEHNSQRRRVKMVRNQGCPFTFQNLLSETFKHMEPFATEIDSTFRKSSNQQTFGCINTFGSLPIDLEDLGDLGDLDIGWTEQDIVSIIDELEHGYHQSVQASCIQLAKESSSSDDFLQKLCAIEHIIQKFVRIVSESQDVLVVRNMLTVLKNIWDYSRVRSNIYSDFLDSLETKWEKSQTIQLGPTQWTINESPEVVRVITESRNLLCSA